MEFEVLREQPPLEVAASLKLAPPAVLATLRKASHAHGSSSHSRGHGAAGAGSPGAAAKKGRAAKEGKAGAPEEGSSVPGLSVVVKWSKDRRRFMVKAWAAPGLEPPREVQVAVHVKSFTLYETYYREFYRTSMTYTLVHSSA